LRTGSSDWASQSSTKLEPIKPAPPVTKIICHSRMKVELVVSVILRQSILALHKNIELNTLFYAEGSVRQLTRERRRVTRAAASVGTLQQVGGKLPFARRKKTPRGEVFYIECCKTQAAWMLEACLPLGPCVTSN
jgi:hypothetical protein